MTERLAALSNLKSQVAKTFRIRRWLDVLYARPSIGTCLVRRVVAAAASWNMHGRVSNRCRNHGSAVTGAMLGALGCDAGSRVV